MVLLSDTIAAIATAPGEGGIAIVRVSGPDSFAIADRIFRCSGPPPSQRAGGTFVYGFVRSAADQAAADADEAVLLIFRAPHSYTREDVVEIQSHGGYVCSKRILKAVLDAGARMAEPGEFTRRAFLNGRIDLLQAEAVLDLIRARSDRAAIAAMEQLEGKLSRAIASIYDRVLNIASAIEAAIDFPDDEAILVPQEISSSLRVISGDIHKLTETWEEGRILREGALVVIAGLPNAGKSTLFNLLLGSERAIVTQHPGTTRDTLEQDLIIDGFPIRLVDTAGIRDTECEIERAGVVRALDMIQKSDLCVLVHDATQTLHSSETGLLTEDNRHRVILVMNKVDLLSGDLKNTDSHYEFIPACLLKGDGVDSIRSAVINRLLSRGNYDSVVMVSERHRSILAAAKVYLDQSITIFEHGETVDFVLVASLIASSLELIGSISGKVYTDDILNGIFSRFCIGK